MNKSEFIEMNEKKDEEIKPEFNRYNNSKVYKLINDVDDYYYVGSSACNSLSKRLWEHKAKSKKYPERKVYKHFNNIGGNMFALF